MGPDRQTAEARAVAPSIAQSLFLSYNPTGGDPAASSIHWLQFVTTNAPLGTRPNGTPYIDNGGRATPFYDVAGGAADRTGFVDVVVREVASIPMNAALYWQADLFLVQDVDSGGGGTTEMVWQGISWGWRTSLAPIPAPAGGGLQNNVPDSQFASLGQNRVLSTLYGNPFSVSAPEAGINEIQATLTALDGTMALNGIVGLDFGFTPDTYGSPAGSGTGGDSTMTFRGSVAAINTALDGLILTPTSAGSGSIEIQSNDLDHNTTGSAETANNTIVVTIADAPLNSVPDQQSTNDGTNLTLSTANGNLIAVSYVANSGDPIQVTLNATNGTMALSAISGLDFGFTPDVNGSPAGSGTGGDTTLTFRGSQADINAALDGLVFTPTTFGIGSVEIITNDLGNNAESTPETADNAVRIAVYSNGPVNRYPVAQTVEEGTDLVLSSATGNAFAVKEHEAGSDPVQVTLTVTDGTVALSGTTGLSFSFSDGYGTGSTSDTAMVFRGTVSAIDAALAGMVFTPTAYGSGSIEITTNDMGHNSLSTPESADNTVDIFVTDGPTATVPAMQTVNTNGSVVFSSANGNAVILADPGAGANSIQVELDATNGTIALSGDSGLDFDFADGYGTGAGTWSGDTTLVFRGSVSDINASLDGLTFTPTTDYGGFAQFDILTNDLGNNAASTAQTNFAAAGIYVNQAPVNVVPATQNVGENDTLTFSSGGSNAISVGYVNASSSSTIQVTLNVSNGTVSLSTTSGLSFSFSDDNGVGSGTGTDDGSVTFRGSVTDVNAALAGMTFTPDTDYSGPAQVEIFTNDLGVNASGLPLTADNFVTVDVQTLMVTTTSDASVHSGESLRDAITTANADAADGISDTILFDPSLNGETITLVQGVLDLSGAGSGIIAIEGYGQITVSGGGASGVFEVDSGVSALLDGLTIQDGVSTDGGGINNAGSLTLIESTITGDTASGNGGGVYNDGSLTVNGSTISGNSAYGSGGGIYGSGTMNLSDCTISDNTAGAIVGGVGSSDGGGVCSDGTLVVSDSSVSANNAWSGGGIFGSGVLSVNDSTISANLGCFGGGVSGGGYGGSATAILNDCTITGNTADCSSGGGYGTGGGVFINGTLTVNGCAISANSAFTAGGGISSFWALEVSDSTISGNTAGYISGGNGGGVYSEGPTTLNNCTISGNSAGNSGGGVWGSDVTVNGSTISGNVAGDVGGGVSDRQGIMTLIDCTISGNTALGGGGGSGGGGVYINGTLSMSNCTVSGNSGKLGGGIFNYYGSVTLQNTIVAGNTTAMESNGPNVYGTVAGTNNLVGDGTGMTGISNGDAYGNQVGTSGSPLDPGLGTLQDNGGPTYTMAILSTSSLAYNAGGAVTTLSASISSTTATTIYVNNAAAIASTPGQYYIMIDSEVMEVTNVDVATGALTVVRGFDGTTAATHADNADVYLATDQRGDLWITQDIGAYAYYGT
jgi:hypothetical protein